MAHRLGVIGAGNMGGAILRGAIDAGILPADQILVCEVDPAGRKSAADLGCDVADDAAEMIGCQQIMLAVKPQGFSRVAECMGRLTSSTIVISIMAGLSSASIRRSLGDLARVIRVMPNTPCQISAGIAGVALGDGAKPGDEKLTLSLFNAIGKTVLVDESLMYAVTAVSGGGPAYVFLLAEMMQAAAEAIDIDESTARQLVYQTILGAAKLLNESNQSASALREAVTSPNGTTAEALKVMFDAQWPQEMKKALAAARDRGIALDEV